MGHVVGGWESASDYLSGLAGECEVVAQRAATRFAALSPEQLGWRPAPESWSAGECLDHLVRTHGLYLESIDRSLAGSRFPSVPGVGFESGPIASRFVRWLGPDSPRRLKTTRLFKPAAVEPGGTVETGLVGRFVEQQRDIVSAIDRCRGVDLQRTKVSSPASDLLRFRLGDALRLMVEHNKRHLKQAEAVLASAGFPSE